MLRLTVHPRGTSGYEPESGFNPDGLTPVHAWRDAAGLVRAQGYVGGGARWINWPGLAAFRLDAAGRVEAFPEPGSDAARVNDLWRRTVHPLMHQALGRETLHASGVSIEGRIVAFTGERRSGKSTIAYALARRGYEQCADDTLVLGVGADAVRVVRLPFEPRLRPDSSVFFGGASVSAEPTPLDEHPELPGVPLAAIFVLGRTDCGEPRAERLSASSAFTAILAHAHCFAPDDPALRRRTLEQYLEIAARVPVYALRFAPGLEKLDAVLACIEGKL